HCHLRANLVDEEVIRNLHEAGCISIKMAIETADDELRNKVLKRGISKEQIFTACNLLKKYNIKFLTQNILGIPGGSLEKDFETLKMNVKIKPDYLCATLLQVYPKTQISEHAKNCGIYDEATSSVPASFFHKSVLEIKDKKKVERLRDLFLLIVEFPMLLHITKFLISLPLDSLYYFADKVWKGYCNKHRIYPYKLTPKEYFDSLIIYFKANYY
ncbi:radical SAM protein, partial [bacterium]|nr:radical SAM protein [bacterium]